MAISEILASIDREIRLLQQARTLLSGKSAAANAAQAGRPEKTGKRTGKKRRLSPEGRRRIAEAVKRRWELHRKAAAGKK
jgi:hypothetical protein